MANRRFIDFPIAASVGDNDIVLIWQDGLNKQTTKATLLQGSPQSLAGLTDVDIAGLTNGQILQYNSTLGKWENVDRTDINLSELGDVTIVAPTNGQVLVYNSSTSKWENSSGGYVPYTGAVTTVNLGAQSILAGSFVKAGGTSSQFLKADGSVDSTAYGTGSVTSVGLTMPSAFNVANSPITTNGTLAVTGAGTVAQYIRGDGSLADFPESSGGGSSVSYYLNGSISQGTIGGVAYRELSKVPILGAGTDFTINADGYIASFITDAGDPNLLEIPGGNWNLETYFSASSGGGSPTFYVELYKVNSGGTATLIASNSGSPELIAFGTNLTAYFSSLAVPTTTLALTDRLAIRYYVAHSGRTITLHTENNHLCQIITTFTTGLTALNGLTAQVQNFATGTTGTDFNIASATATHTFNLPTASGTNRGALSSADWSTFNGKQNALTLTTSGTSGAATLVGSTLNIPQYQSVLTNPVTGTGTTNYLPKFTGSTTIGNSVIADNASEINIPKRIFLNSGSESIFLTPNLSSASNRIEGSSGVPLEITTGGSSLKFAAGGTTPQFTLASSGAATFTGSVTASSIIKSGGTSTQYLMADGSVSTLTNPVTGTGTTNYLPKFTGSTTIGNSAIIDNGTSIEAISRTFIVNRGSHSAFGFEIDQQSTFAFGSTNGKRVAIIRDSTLADNGLQFGYDAVDKTGIIAGSATSSGTGIDFYTYNGSSWGNRMRITSGGNVLIGTTTDAGYKLDVNGTGRFNASSAALSLSSSSDLWFNITRGSSFTNFGIDSTGVFYNTNTSHRFLTNSGVTTALTLASSGAATFSSSVTAGGNFLIPAGSGLAWSGDASRIMTPEDNVSGALIQTPGIIRLNAGGSERMRITSSGNVGIGTTTPGARLNIAGNLGAVVGAGNSAIRMTNTDSGNYASIGAGIVGVDNPGMQFSVDGTSRMVITGGGNLLVGTTTDAGYKLDVNGTGRFSGALTVSGTSTLTGRVFSIEIGVSKNGSDSVADGPWYRWTNAAQDRQMLTQLNASNGLTTWAYNGSTWSSVYTLTQAGNVGIGTSSPGQALQVNGRIRVSPDGVNGGDMAVDAGGLAFSTIGNTTPITFQRNNFSAESMRITSSGNVGIGTTSPNRLLTVSGTQGYIALNATSYRNTTIGSDSVGNFIVYDDTAAAYRMVINSSGNVLIGTTTDNGAKLNVNGTIRTANPTGSTSDGWLLGRALVSGTSSPDRWIRVQIGNLYYDILAVYMGSV